VGVESWIRSLTSAFDGDQLHAPAASTPGKELPVGIEKKVGWLRPPPPKKQPRRSDKRNSVYACRGSNQDSSGEQPVACSQLPDDEGRNCHCNFGLLVASLLNPQPLKM